MKEKIINNIFYAVVLILLLVLVYNTYKINKSEMKTRINKINYFDLAVSLKERGLTESAEKMYLNYINSSNLNEAETLSIYQAVAEMFFENHEYKKALKYYTIIENLSKNTNDDIKKKIVNCLEQTGLKREAQLELEKSVSLNEQLQPNNVLAIVGNKKITKDDLNKELIYYKQTTGDTKIDINDKKNLLNQIIFRELLYNKGLRAGLNNDKEIKQKVMDLEKNLIINKSYKDEIIKKIDVSDIDLKNYYKVNKSKYSKDDKDNFEEKKEEIKKDYIQEKQQEITQKLISDALKTQDIQVFYELLK